jgi:4-amino-4-deoxy-L-arabinose transferase-like glycosyltransferase
MVTEAKNENQPATLTSERMTMKVHRVNWIAVTSAAILCAGIAFLLLVRLDVYPGPSFDEGAFLKVAKNYALTGHYADFSLGENRYTGAVVSTGPTVILPIALLYKVFGPSIVLGRLVVVAYSALLLFAVFAVGNSLLSKRLALGAVVLVLCLPGIGFVYLARSVFGEFPGLFFVFAGLWLWIRPGKRRLVDLVIIGVIFGCGAITKNQYAPIILAGIFMSWLADLFWFRRRGPLYFIVPGLVAGLFYAGWTYYVLFLLGAQERNVAGDLQLLRSATSSALILFDSSINNTNLRTLIQDNVFLLPVLGYGLVSLLRRDDQEQRWSILVIFLLISVVMFIFSNGYSRYEVAPQILGALIVVRLVSHLMNGFQLNKQALRNLLRGKQLSLAATISLFVIVLLADQYLRPMYLQTVEVATSGTNAPYLVQQYLDTVLPLNTVIATYESTLGVLTNHAYIFAPYSTVVDLTVKKRVDVTVDPSLYNFLFTQDAEFLIIGPFAESLGYYVPERLQPEYDLVFAAGDYEVYRRKEQTF